MMALARAYKILIPVLVLVLSWKPRMAQPPFMTVNTRLGTVTGVNRDLTIKKDTVSSVTTFQDIPYGKPPIGKMRFQKPQPYGPFGTHEVFQGVKSCEPGMIIPGFGAFGSNSEDCLYLDIYSPNPVVEGPKKGVLIWIHSSSLLFGNKGMASVDWISALGDVIVVVPNYRLGLHGLFTTMDGNAPGNLALWDVHLVIKWVHENIEDYGGDPNTITIIGFPGTSGIASAQALYPGNKGLLKRVIFMSSAPSLDFFGVDDPISFMLTLVEKSGCSRFTREQFLQNTQSITECMRRADSANLTEVMNGIITELQTTPPTNLMAKAPYGLFIDGEFIKTDPIKALRDPNSEERKMFQSLDLLTGVVSQEGSIFVGLITEYFTTKYNFEIWKGIPTEFLCKELVPSIVDTFYNSNPMINRRMCETYTVPGGDDVNITEQGRQTSNLFGDFIVVKNVAETIRIHSESNYETTSFQYLWTQPYQTGFFSSIQWIDGVEHGSELTYFLYVLSNSWGNTDAAMDFSRQVIKMWTAFVNKGNPSTEFFRWPAYKFPMNQNYAIINPTFDTGINLYDTRMNFWLAELPRLLVPKVVTTTEPGTPGPPPPTRPPPPPPSLPSPTNQSVVINTATAQTLAPQTTTSSAKPTSGTTVRTTQGGVGSVDPTLPSTSQGIALKISKMSTVLIIFVEIVWYFCI